MTKIELLTLTDNALDNTVKIQGTKYDRKRKLTDATIKKILNMGKKSTYQEIARKLGLNPTTVRYNLDPEWKAAFNLKRSGKHTGKDHITKLNRVAYKRSLVAAGKVTA